MRSITWNIDNVASVAGNPTTMIGSPRVIDTPAGRAVEFNGASDALLVARHPMTGWSQFTAEVIFRPDAGGLPEQRFFHMQEDGGDNRILFETRLTKDNQWFLDTYIKSNAGDRALLSEQFKHPVGEWYALALVFDGSQMRDYVNGKLELSAPISFTPPGVGKTSIGVRINRVHWFKGAIRQARFTPSALAPEQFLKP